MAKSGLRIIFSTIVNIVIFLAVIWLLNYLSRYIHYSLFLQIVDFLNSNLHFIISLFLVLFLGEIFRIFRFPFNLLYPIFSAIGGVMAVFFIFSILELINQLFSLEFYDKISGLKLSITIIVSVIVIIAGYVSILAELGRKEAEEKKRKEGIRWSDIGEEFKFALYGIAYSIRKTFAKEKQAGKKKKRKKAIEEDI